VTGRQDLLGVLSWPEATGLRLAQGARRVLLQVWTIRGPSY